MSRLLVVIELAPLVVCTIGCSAMVHADGATHPLHIWGLVLETGANTGNLICLTPPRFELRTPSASFAT
jgi:hypothetical protein